MKQIRKITITTVTTFLLLLTAIAETTAYTIPKFSNAVTSNTYDFSPCAEDDDKNFDENIKD